VLQVHVAGDYSDWRQNSSLEASSRAQRETCQSAGVAWSGRRRSGNAAIAAEDSRRIWIAGWAESLAHDLRYGARSAPSEGSPLVGREDTKPCSVSLRTFAKS